MFVYTNAARSTDLVDDCRRNRRPENVREEPDLSLSQKDSYADSNQVQTAQSVGLLRRYPPETEDGHVREMKYLRPMLENLHQGRCFHHAREVMSQQDGVISWDRAPSLPLLSSGLHQNAFAPT
jgi:hypothetical protein